MEKRAVRIAVFVAVFTGCLLLSARCTLPGAFLTHVAEAQLEEALRHQYTVDIEKAGLRGIVGAKLRNVRLTSRKATLSTGAPIRVVIPKVTVSVSPLKLLGRNIDATLRAEVGGGRLEVDVNRNLKSSAQSYEVRLFDVNLSAFPFVEAKLGLPLSGVLRGTLAGGFDVEGRLTQGNVDLNVLNTQLGPGAIPNEILPPDVRRFWTSDIAFPAVDIGDVLLRAPINGSQAEIETFRVVGEDVRSSGEGRVILRDPLNTSQIQASIRLAVEQSFIEEADLGGIIGSVPELRGMSRGGEMLFTLSGPVTKPQVSSRQGASQ